MRNMELSKSITLNICLVFIWNVYIFFICRDMKNSFFNPEKNSYKEKKFEHSGKFYTEKLKIKKWKEFLPQYISKNGFSKKNFSSKNLTYINRFILETCRAEWNHKMCMLISFPILILNTLKIGMIFTLFILLTNLPFIFIQRYNRLRLLALKEHKLKKYSFLFKENNKSQLNHSRI